MTLVELVVAIVVLGVALSGVLLVYSVAVRGSADPIVQRQMQVLAEEMMEEVSLKPYARQDNAASAACARNTFNDVDDYNGFATEGQICDIDGNPIGSLAGYSIAVSVAASTIGGVSAAKRIEVTVSRAGQQLALRAWRVDYASEP